MESGGIKMQQETYYVGKLIVVPVAGLTRKRLFNGIETEARDDTSIKVEREEITRRLQEWIPNFVDETVRLCNVQGPSISADTNYYVHLPNGKVYVAAKIHDDLGKFLSNPYLDIGYEEKGKREEIASLLQGKSGVRFIANYHWDGNERKGLQLGRIGMPSDNYLEGTLFGILFEDKYYHIFNKIINALCQGREFSEEIVHDRDLKLHNPLSYADGATEIYAWVRDVSLEAVRAADQPVSEFMKWMHENALQVNTMGEFARLAAAQYSSASACRERVEAGKVVATLPVIVREVGDRYLKLTQEAFAELKPPQNNRMDYLIH